jgi:hypothetical protein
VVMVAVPISGCRQHAAIPRVPNSLAQYPASMLLAQALLKAQNLLG